MSVMTEGSDKLVEIEFGAEKGMIRRDRREGSLFAWDKEGSL